jgi:hypothetical protein
MQGAEMRSRRVAERTYDDMGRGGMRSVLNVKGCTGLRPSMVRRVFLTGLSPATATLKLDVRDCPALFSIQHEFPQQCRQVTNSSHVAVSARERPSAASARRTTDPTRSGSALASSDWAWLSTEPKEGGVALLAMRR